MNLQDNNGNFAVVGAIVGAGLNVVVDFGIAYQSNQPFGLRDAVRSASVGAVGGAVGAGFGQTVYKSVKVYNGIKQARTVAGILGGAAAGASASVTDQVLDNGNVNMEELVGDTVAGGGAGVVASKLNLSEEVQKLTGVTGVAAGSPLKITITKGASELADGAVSQPVSRHLDEALDAPDKRTEIQHKEQNEEREGENDKTRRGL